MRLRKVCLKLFCLDLVPILFSSRTSVPTYHPEYGRFMLESTPGSPYTGSLTDLLCVESNMRVRYVYTAVLPGYAS